MKGGEEEDASEGQKCCLTAAIRLYSSDFVPAHHNTLGHVSFPVPHPSKRFHPFSFRPKV